MDGGGEWKYEIWTDLRSGRRIKIQTQGVGARPSILERRNVLARGTYNRPTEGDRLAGKQSLPRV